MSTSTRAPAAKLESRTQSGRDLVALAGSGWSPPGRVDHVPEDSSFAVRPPPLQPAPTKKRTGGPFTTGVPCNPETAGGLLAAVKKPASALLRVAEPLRAGARSIMALTAERCCNGACGTPYCGTPRTPFQADESMFTCKLCSHRIGGGNVYMYMDNAFCMPECRYEYLLEELFEERRKLGVEERASKRARRAGSKAAELTEEEDRKFRRIFFACDEDESSFP